MSTVLQTIEVDAQEVLSVIDKLLPFAEKYIPKLATLGGPIGLGVSFASDILSLIAMIPIGPVFTVEQQQSYRDRVQALVLLDFSGPQWQQQGKAPAVP